MRIKLCLPLRVTVSPISINCYSKNVNQRIQKFQKIAILQKIRDCKEILFGAFSPELTKQTKAGEWKKIHSFALTMGVIAKEKDFVYVRDTYWPNIKRTTKQE